MDRYIYLNFKLQRQEKKKKKKKKREKGGETQLHPPTLNFLSSTLASSYTINGCLTTFVVVAQPIQKHCCLDLMLQAGLQGPQALGIHSIL